MLLKYNVFPKKFSYNEDRNHFLACGGLEIKYDPVQPPTPSFRFQKLLVCASKVQPVVLRGAWYTLFGIPATLSSHNSLANDILKNVT